MWFKENRRIKRLEEGLEEVQMSLKALELEWENVYRKLRKIMGRLHKEDAISNPSVDGKGEEPLPPVNEPSGRLLTPRQQQIQQQILRRRAGMAQ